MILLSNFFILLLSCAIILGAASSTAKNTSKEQNKSSHETSGLLDHILHLSADDDIESDPDQADVIILENDDEIQIKPIHTAAAILNPDEEFAPIGGDIFDNISADLTEETFHIKNPEEEFDADIAAQENTIITHEQNAGPGKDQLEDIRNTINDSDSNVAEEEEGNTENDDLIADQKNTETAEDKLENIRNTINDSDSNVAEEEEGNTENDDLIADQKNTGTAEDKLEDIRNTINDSDSNVAEEEEGNTENDDLIVDQKNTEKELPITKITSSKNVKKDSSNLKINTTNKVLTKEAIPANKLAIDKNTVANIMQNTKASDIDVMHTTPDMDADQDIKIIPRAKPIENPFLINGAEFFNSANYNGNKHLTAPTYIEEYYQLLFATVLTEDTEGVKAITRKIGVNYDIFVDNLSPLTYAINNNNNPDTIRQMLSLGYTPNSMDLNNKSPLYYAVELQKYDFAIELLLWGANPNFGAAEEITPFDLAMHNDDTIMLDILRRAEVK
ncbi:MAG: hypothetical protein HON23_00805 [Rickettsiales bacterium]|nr:hypothetical protein [Rickettsiales bacterium]